ncbi:hypothetical protein B0T14DRAFT_75739 [Immersiella caudata]|uniref:Uncharacterized protein n=1 Tax=Immersiella caudata TaxID=314043 RepID=A0AA40CCQ5_9PEZI|nr:hypothetical protein B0T14DRAFT_75739 [Immersiella caudata]
MQTDGWKLTRHAVLVHPGSLSDPSPELRGVILTEATQLVPQIWTNWRTKKTDGLPRSMMLLWALCNAPMGAYASIQRFNIPLQIQPQCFMTLCLVSWVRTLTYHNRWSVWKASALGVVTMACFVRVEIALIFTLTNAEMRYRYQSLASLQR